MTCRFFHFIKNSNGSTAIEFALVVPALMLIITSIVEGGHAYLVYSDLTYALDDVGRYAMIHPDATNSELSDQAMEAVNRFPAEDMRVTIVDTVIGSTNYREITLAYDLPTFAGSVIGNETITLTRTTSVPLVAVSGSI